MDPTGWDHREESLDGIPFAHWQRGRGTPVLALHGIGPGTTGFVNFAPILDRLCAVCELHLIDLIGFGRSGRKRAEPYFDVPLWLRQAAQVIAQLGGRRMALLGNSVGGALALKLAATEPSVRSVIAIGAPAERYAIPPALQRFWSVPANVAELAENIRPMTAAQAPPAAALVEARFASFADPAYRAYFSAMLAGTKQAQLEQAALSDEEALTIKARVWLLHGRQDRAVPAELTAVKSVRRLPQANFLLLADCGHNVLSERTALAASLIEQALGQGAQGGAQAP